MYYILQLTHSVDFVEKHQKQQHTYYFTAQYYYNRGNIQADIIDIIHWNLLKKHNLNVSDKYWEYLPRGFENNAEINIYYEKPIQLGQYIDNRANQPDIIVHNKKNKETQII